MSATLEQVTEEVRELSPQDQRQLLALLVRDLEPVEKISPDEIEAAWDEEISRQLEEFDSGKAKPVSTE